MSETERKQAFVFFSETEPCFLPAQDEFPVPVTLGPADVSMPGISKKSVSKNLKKLFPEGSN